jgi:rod shape-determining protein MreD
MNDIARHLLRALAFLAVEALLLDRVPPLHRFLSPSIYLLYLLWLPFRLGRLPLLGIGFLYGLILDMFTHTPGLHASACTLAAFLRPYLIQVLMPRLDEDLGRTEPSTGSMGAFPYATYLALMTLAHQGWLLFLEWLDLGDAGYFAIKVVTTSALSLTLMAVTEAVFRNRGLEGRTGG